MHRYNLYSKVLFNVAMHTDIPSLPYSFTYNILLALHRSAATSNAHSGIYHLVGACRLTRAEPNLE